MSEQTVIQYTPSTIYAFKHLYGADLSEANLYRANMYGANLSGATGRTDWDELIERGAIR